MSKQSFADQMAQELLDWIEAESDDVVEALFGTPFEPQVVRPPRSEALAFVRSKFLTPDGMVNPEGIADFESKFGPQEYRAVAEELAKNVPSPEGGY